MNAVQVQFLGTGDAFGSGGRLQTCFHVTAETTRFLIDCGPSALTAMKRHGVDRALIDTIVLSHLHGDHFGGIPFFLLDAHFVVKRTRPLLIAGPPTTEARMVAALETLFPGSAELRFGFDLEFVELAAEIPTALPGLTVTPYPVIHPSGAPSYGLRIEVDGRTIAYSGDTEWTEALIPVSRNADLFICECFLYEREVRYHLNYRTLERRRADLSCRRLMLTHMSDEMLERLDEIEIEAATDGLVIEL